VHWPAVHPSAPSLHALQALPAAPQAVAEGVLQVTPEQHPSGHRHPLHAPPTQVWLLGHAAQACPALPHAVSPRPVWHASPLQHPVHDVGSQRHLPPWQCCPVSHASPDPQWHVPSVPQPSLVVAEHPVQTQRPAEHDRPGGQEAPLPQCGPRSPCG
jgi:hypothetical protein